MRRNGDSSANDNRCPVCGGAVAEPDPGRIAACPACTHRWLPSDPIAHARLERDVYVHDYAGYRNDPRLVDSFEDILARFVSPLVEPGARILDVGCGAGTFLQVAQRAGFAVTGLDVSPAAAAICRAKGLCAEAGDFLGHHPRQPYAVVTFWDVIEHLRTPHAFLAHAAALVGPGGLVVGKVPVFGRLTVGLADRVARLRGVMLGAPEHVGYANARSLGALLDRFPGSWEFLPVAEHGMRTPAMGGSLKKRAARAIRSRIAALSGDGNLVFVLRPV
jgi:SAM-dependent methyltransferase